MPPASSVEWINMLIYGESGAGKTTLGGTAQDHPMTAPLIVIDVEGGSLTLRERTDVDVVQVRSMKEVRSTAHELRADTSHYYKTALIDSGTELQKLDMRNVMQDQFNKKPETTDIYVPSQREWGKSGERMREIIREFKDLPMNTIVTCLLAEVIDDKTNKRLFYPSLPGKLRSEIPGFFDIVGLLRAKDEKGENADEITIVRTLQVTKTEAVIAKDRTNALPALIREPTIPMIWDFIHANNKKG